MCGCIVSLSVLSLAGSISLVFLLLSYFHINVSVNSPVFLLVVVGWLLVGWLVLFGVCF